MNLHSSSAGIGVTLAMFFAYAGIAANQFHGYLFELLGQDAMSIGILLMTGYVTGIFAPLVQVYLIRKWHGPYLPLAVVALGSAMAMAYLPHAPGFWGLWFTFGAVSFCLASIFPLLNAATLETTRGRGHSLFVWIRGIGTAGFLFATLLCWLLPHSEKLPIIYAGFGFGFLLCLVSIAPAAQSHHRLRLQQNLVSVPAPPFFHAWRRLFRGETIALLLLLAAMNYANVMATAMQGNYLIHRFGLQQGSISLAWSVSTACELVWMGLCARAVKSTDIRQVMVFGLWGTGIKLFLLAVAPHFFTFVVGLVFHGLFFSYSLTGFGVYLDRRFRANERPGLQVLTSGIVGGIPAALAGLSAGWLWKHLGLHAVYVFSAGLALCICLAGQVWVRGRLKSRPRSRIGYFQRNRRIHP